jgi:hypothetical protein
MLRVAPTCACNQACRTESSRRRSRGTCTASGVLVRTFGHSQDERICSRSRSALSAQHFCFKRICLANRRAVVTVLPVPNGDVVHSPREALIAEVAGLRTPAIDVRRDQHSDLFLKEQPLSIYNGYLPRLSTRVDIWTGAVHS